MATLPEIKHSIRTSTAAYISAYFEEHETYPVDIGLIHGDFIAEELYEGFSWSDEINGFYEFSGGAPAAPLLFDRWISLTTTGDYQANWYYEWDGLQWNEISPKIGKPYWIKSQELHRYFNGDIWAQLAGVVGTTDHRELSNLNSAGYWHLTELEYDYFSGLSNLLGGKENVGVAAGLVALHETNWNHDSFLTALPEHEHDSRYYTETETNSLLSGKQPLHNNLTQISGLPATAGNFIVGNGTSFVGRALQNSDLPAIAITDTFVVASQAAMLALTAAERGDVAVRTDLNKSFILKGDIYSSLSDWTELLSPTDAVLSVDGRTGVVDLTDRYNPIIAAGTTNQFLSWDKTMRAVDWTYIANKPSSFAPSAHDHLAADLPSNVVYTDNTQTIAGAKTFTQATVFDSAIVGNNVNGLAINMNTVDGSDTKYVSLFGAGGNASRAGGLVAYGNEHPTGHGDLRLYAGEGSNGVTGAIVANSKLLTKKAIASEQGTGLYTYKDVLHFNTSQPAVSYTGTCKIAMPVSWSNTMLQIKISGYDYGGLGAWECVVSGYNYVPGAAWYHHSAEIRGQAPFTNVRLAHDGTKCVLLLGNTSTVWQYPQIAITDVIAGYSNQDAWGSGWGLSFITSESGIGSVVSPAVQSMARSDHNHSGVYQPLLSLISEYAGMVSFNFGSTWMSFGNTSNGQTISTSGNLQLSPASGSGIIMNGWEDHSGAYTYNNVLLEYQGAGTIPTADYAAIRITYPSNHVYSLEAGLTMQRIVVINSTTSAVHEIEGQLVGPGKFCDFLYDGTKWYSEY